MRRYLCIRTLCICFMLCIVYACEWVFFFSSHFKQINLYNTFHYGLAFCYKQHCNCVYFFCYIYLFICCVLLLFLLFINNRSTASESQTSNIPSVSLECTSKMYTPLHRTCLTLSNKILSAMRSVLIGIVRFIDDKQNTNTHICSGEQIKK